MFAPRPTIADPALSPRPTSEASVWAALAGTSTWKGIADKVFAPAFDEDPQFNPFDHIRQTPDLAGDPVLGFLVERGQFDRVRSRGEFEYQLDLGRQFIKDAETVAKSSHPLMLQLLGGVADPLNIAAIAVAPFTGGGSLLGVGRTTLGAVGRAAALGGAANLASHELQAALQPVSNEPGAVDELMAGLTGAAFGGGVSWLAHNVGQRMPRQVPTVTMQRIRRGVDELANSHLPDSLVGETPMSKQAKSRPASTPESPEFHSPWEEIPDDVLARSPEPDPVLPGEDGPAFDSVLDSTAPTPAGPRTLRERVREYVRDTLRREPFGESLYQEVADTFDVKVERVRGWVDTVRSKVEAETLAAKGAQTPFTVVPRNGAGTIAGDVAATTDAPLGMLTGLDDAIVQAESAATPAFPGPRADPEIRPLTGERLTEAEAIQERLMAPRTPKTWHGRPGFVLNPFAKSPKSTVNPPRPTVPTMTLDDALVHELDHGYKPFLADTPEPHRTLFVLADASPEITAAQNAIRAKYIAAGVPLNEVPHPLQGFNDLVQAARQLTRDPAWNTAATAAELNQGAITGIVRAAEREAMRLINPITPGGRITGERSTPQTPDAIVSRLNDAYRTLAGSAQTVTRGNAVSPFTHFSPTAAESIKGLVGHQKDMALLDLHNIYAAGGRGKDFIEYGQTKISTRFGFGAFKDAVTDYYRTMNAKSGGYDVKPPANVDPSIVKAANRIKEHFNGQRDRMSRVGMLEYDTASLGRVNASLRRRRAITDKHRQAIAAEKASASPDPAKVARLEGWRRSSAAKENRLADRARVLKFSKARHEWYLPRVYDVPTVRRMKEAFTTDLERAFYETHNIDRAGNRVTTPDERPLLATIAGDLDQAGLEADIVAKDPAWSFSASASTKSGTVAQVHDKVLYEAIAEMTEGDLSPALREAYRDRLTAHYRGKAAGAFESIAGKDAEGTRQLANRSMFDLDETVLDRWTETDLERLIHRSHFAIDGRYAIREAIRLNPEMNGKTLSDGKPIVTEDDLVAYATDLPDLLLRRMGEKNDTIDPAFRQSLESFRVRAERDIRGIVNALTGMAAHRPEHRLLAGSEFMGRQLLKLEFLNKMGGAAWNTINDIAPVSIYMATRPQLWAEPLRAVLHLKSLPTRDLHALDAGFDGLVRSRLLGNIDLETGGVGVEGSAFRKLTSAIDSGTSTASDAMARVSLLSWITNVQKRVAGVVTIDYGTSLSKRLIKAANIAGRNADEAARNAALIKAGLGERYDVARLNKMGFNVDTALEYHRQVYKHGLMRDDSPVSGKFKTFDDYLNADEFVKPNFDGWDSTPAVDDVKLRVMAGMSNEVNRFYVVTPGVADVPLLQARYPTTGRLLNQFQSFGMAFGNQRLAAIGQMPLKYQVGHIGVYILLGAMADAIKNHLSGRRSFDDSATMWRENPLGGLYGAWNVSGLSGWLQRPLAITDNMNLPFSPGVVMGNSVGSSSARHFNPANLASVLGPGAGDLEQGLKLAFPASNSLAESVGMEPTGEGWGDAQTRSSWKMAPFQNLFWFRLAHRFGGLPVVPESLGDN